MYEDLCSYENLFLAYKNARKRKTKKRYVKRFEKNLQKNLMNLRQELLSKTYITKPMQTFIIRDPKTRKISKSAFRDRIVHHAIINVIEPVFDKTFIYDSHANRKGQGTLRAIERFDLFKRKVSKNNTRPCFILKADIKHYFEEVDHAILISILKKKIDDENFIWLIKQVLNANFRMKRELFKGMSLGNLTSQFFANLYLNELDQFVKHILKAKYYIRYVDDFVILDNSKEKLKKYKKIINEFIKDKLKIELHPNKSNVINLRNGISFLGFRIFYYNKLLRKSNMRKFERKLNLLKVLYKEDIVSREKAVEFLEGWVAYSSHGNTYKYRRHIIRLFNRSFSPKKHDRFRNPKKFRNYIKKVEESELQFSTQKTLYLYKKGLSVEEIAQQRAVKEGTIWEHLIELIEHGHLPVWNVLPKRKIVKILPKIKGNKDLLKNIKIRISDTSVSYNEIACVLAYVKFKNRIRKNMLRKI